MTFIMRAAMALMALAVLAGTASAQVKKDDNELGGRGSFSSGKYESEDSALTQLEGNVFFGRFLTNRLEVGPSINFNKLEGEDFTGGVSGFVDYHFGDIENKTVPFVEVAAGKFIGGDKGTVLSFGPGLKWFVGDGGGTLVVFPFYRRVMYDEDRVGYATRNEFVFSVGLSINFP